MTTKSTTMKLCTYMGGLAGTMMFVGIWPMEAIPGEDHVAAVVGDTQYRVAKCMARRSLSRHPA